MNLLMRGRMVHYNGYIDVDPAPASIAVTDAQSDEVEAVTTRVSKRTAASLDELLREADEFKKPPKHSKVTFCAPCGVICPYLMKLKSNWPAAPKDGLPWYGSS